MTFAAGGFIMTVALFTLANGNTMHKLIASLQAGLYWILPEPGKPVLISVIVDVDNNPIYAYTPEKKNYTFYTPGDVVLINSPLLETPLI